jgi:hypothetical protein
MIRHKNIGTESGLRVCLELEPSTVNKEDYHKKNKKTVLTSFLRIQTKDKKQNLRNSLNTKSSSEIV